MKKPQKKKSTKTYRKPYEGGIYYRQSEDRWFIRVPVPGLDKPIIAYAKTEDEAVAKKNQLIAAHITGTYVDPQKKSLSEWLHEWLPDCVEDDVEPSTYFRKQQLVRVHIDSNNIGAIPLQQLKESDFKRLYKELRRTGKKTKVKDENGEITIEVSGLAEQTIWHIHNILNPALNHAVKKKLISENPLGKTKPKEIIRDEAKYLDNDEPVRYLLALEENRYYAAFVLDLSLGLRRGELIGLKWLDITYHSYSDFYTLIIRRQLVREHDSFTGKSKLVLKDKLKTSKSRRTLIIPDIVVKELFAHKLRQDAEKEQMRLLGQVYHDEGLIFCQKNGNMIDTRRLYEIHCRALKAAKIGHVPFHSLRHTFSALMIEYGEDLKSLQEMLGHAQISTTGEIYGHLNDRKKANRAKKLDGIISGIVTKPSLTQLIPGTNVFRR